MSYQAVISAKTRAAKKTAQALGATLALVLLCMPAFSQLNLGRIFGGITDQTGGAVVGATVTVIDEARGVSRPLVSDGAGEYAAPNLTPGSYTVRAEAPGFQVAQHTGILVGVGEDIRVDLTLQPGAQTQTVTVTGELPIVNTTNAQLGGSLEPQSLEEIPTNGRNYVYLLQSKPGVLMKPTGGQNVFTVNGSGIDDTIFLFDGVMDYNIFEGGGNTIGGTGLAADETNILPLDSIQEINVIMSPKAEYGDRYGAQINIGLKSGTNSLHGSAYAFGRDTSLNAKNPFLTSNLPKAALTMEQFGASLGGPIKKSKLFYFMNYEGQRYSVGNPTLAQEPTTADIGQGTSAGISGSFPDALYDILHNASNTTRIPSALSLNLAGCGALVPAGSVTSAGVLSASQVAVLKGETAAQLASGCNVADGIFGNATPSQAYLLELLGTGGSDNSIIKIDYHPNDHHAINGEWFTGGGTELAPGTQGNSVVQPYWSSVNYTWANVARGVWIWTPNSSWSNEVRTGYEYLNDPIFDPECDYNDAPNYANLGLVTGASTCNPKDPVGGGFPSTAISGFGTLGYPNSGATSGDRLDQFYTILDNVSYTRGRHLFKFGGEFRPQMFNGGSLKNERGALTFGSPAAFSQATPLEDFLAGVPGTGMLVVGPQYRHDKFQSYAGYVQDDWRILTRLTLNLGVRYEYTSPMRDRDNLLGNFDPFSNTPTGLIQQTSNSSAYNQDPYDFEPRFGLSWDVFGNGRTVVRAGIGILYTETTSVLHLQSASGVTSVLNDIPTGFTFYNLNGSSFAGPGTIATGNLSLTTAQLGWAINTPIFSATTAGLACGNGFAPVNPVPGAPATNPAPCAIGPLDLNFRPPEGIPRTFGVQHAFTNNLSLDVEYSGLRGAAIAAYDDLNPVTPGAKNGATNVEQPRRTLYSKYPFYADVFEQSTYGWSNYNALQASLTQRVSHGLNFSAGYTLSHNLDSSGGETMANNPQLDYATSTNDVRNVITLTATYVIPGRKSPGQMLEGWQVNTSVLTQSGAPVNADDTTDDISGTGINLDRWTLAGTPKDFKIGGPGPTPCWGVTGSSFSKAANCTTVATVANMPALCQSAAAAEPVNSSLPANTAAATGLTALSTYGCYMMGSSVIVPPAQGTYGTMARDALNGKAFRNWDISASKNWKFRERYGAQFRAEFFNIINRTHYSLPTVNLAAPTSFGESSSTDDVGGGNPVLGPGPRKIQFGFKLTF